MIGTLLGNRYEILELVGTGGMANVYKARCTMLNRFVAIKVLKDEYSNDQEFLKRFGIESQASAGLSHSNVVSVYDVGVQENIHYIVMEYVDGITLKEYLVEKGALPVEEAIDFSIQIATALNHAHRKGIVHRDIKPQNIIVTRDKQLKVTDFGIARAASTYTMKVDDTGFGSAHYCSPEQASGRYTDERADVYSLGVVMYEMLTGKLPFESDNSVSVAIKHIQEAPVPPMEINPGIPQKVQDVVLKAMEKEQSERFQTAGEFLIELNYVNNTLRIENENRAIYEKIEKRYETKIIDSKAVRRETRDSNLKKEINKPVKSIEKRHDRRPEKKELAQEDKKAIIAAIVSAFVIVFVLSFACVAMMFPSIMPWNNLQPVEDGIAPDLLGAKYEAAVKKYKKIDIVEIDREYSTMYDEGIIISQDPSAETEMEKPYTINVVVSKGAKKETIPYVVNMDYREAEIKLEGLEILHTVQFKESTEVPEGIVIKVTPAEGKEVRANSDLVTLIVSSGPPKKEVEVPNVVGKSKSEAEQLIEKAGLTYSIKKENSTEAENTVIKQSYSAGTKVAEKTTVTITVSNGEAPAADENQQEENQEDSNTAEGGDENNPENNEDADNSDNSENQEKTDSSDNSGNTQPDTTSSTSGNNSVKEITISLPTDRDTVTVKVVVNNISIYEKLHSTSEGAVSVPIRAYGKTTVSYYLDGVKAGERVIEF